MIGVARIKNLEVLAPYDPARVHMTSFADVSRRRQESGSHFIIGVAQVLMDISRKSAARKPFYEEFHQMQIINPSNRMKVDLRIHEKARQHESFGRLDSSFFNPKRCLLRSGILSGRCDRQDAKRIYETIVIALCGGLLGRNTRGGAIVAGALNLGGSIEMIPNAIRIAELAIDKQAQTLLLPVSSRRQLNELPDELWTKISIEFYKDGADAVFKALVE